MNALDFLPMRTWLITALIAVLAASGLSVAGYFHWRGVQRDVGRAEIRAEWAAKDREDADLRASDRRQQRMFNDLASGAHAAVVDNLSLQLKAANEIIFRLPGRACLPGPVVRVLNQTGTATSDQPSGTAASEPASATEEVATDRDVASAIAICRTWYGEVADQLNKILDIEDKRWPPAGVQTRAP